MRVMVTSYVYRDLRNGSTVRLCFIIMLVATHVKQVFMIVLMLLLNLHILILLPLSLDSLL